MDAILQQLIIGLSVGATYALIALGYTMVYGVLKLINFAHGDVYMVGAVSGYYISTWLDHRQVPVAMALPLTFGGAIAICIILGFAIERLAYRPLRGSPRLVALITAIGVSLLLENLAQLKSIFGPTPRYYPNIIHATLSSPILTSQHLNLTRFDLLSLSLSLMLMIGLTLLVMRTRWGLALRAVSFRVDTAALMGIDSNRVIAYTFMFGSALAGAAGVLDGIHYKVDPLMGIMMGLKAFVAAVVGGIGSIPGALVGGLFVGLVETLAKTYISSSYGDAVAFVLLIFILLIKPTGLFGSQAPEKV